MDPKTLTNQPETVSVPSPILSRVVERWEVAAEAGRIGDIVFGRFVDISGANTEEMEAVMTPPGELALALGVD
eukprot:scaffold190874_cov36-Cyclotella_meneghiniana.AAC.1